MGPVKGNLHVSPQHLRLRELTSVRVLHGSHLRDLEGFCSIYALESLQVSKIELLQRFRLYRAGSFYGLAFGDPHPKTEALKGFRA